MHRHAQACQASKKTGNLSNVSIHTDSSTTIERNAADQSDSGSDIHSRINHVRKRKPT